ncbi:MAG: putative metallopeptidase [Candidatus Diapherotrites archaeon]|nr:putative metallopeptidase [Candidatus Diapherotrites archaeon]MDZ4256184.1 putative metallopeptidase [archaeon]
MKYIPSPEWTERTRQLASELAFSHIPPDRIACFMSKGSKSRRTIARIHTMPKIIQMGTQQPPFYAIELISERFDRQTEEEQIKTLIHELMHIPHSFGGGFRQHRPHVTHAKVNQIFQRWRSQTRWETLG